MEELLKEESQDVVTLKNINLRYNGERGEVTALQNVNLNIEKENSFVYWDPLDVVKVLC